MVRLPTRICESYGDVPEQLHAGAGLWRERPHGWRCEGHVISDQPLEQLSVLLHLRPHIGENLGPLRLAYFLVLLLHSLAERRVRQKYSAALLEGINWNILANALHM